MKKSEIKKICKEDGVCKQDFEDLTRSQTLEHKRIDGKLNKLAYLGEEDFVNTLRSIVKERESYEIMRNKWTGKLQFVGLIIGAIVGLISIIYGLGKFLNYLFKG